MKLEVNPEPSLEMFPDDVAYLRGVLPLELPPQVEGKAEDASVPDGERAVGAAEGGGEEQAEVERPKPKELPLSPRWKLVYSAAALRQLRMAMRALADKD